MARIADQYSAVVGRVVGRLWWMVALCALVGAISGLGASLMATPMYSAEARLYVTSGTDANSVSAYQGSLASQQRVTSYAELVVSDAVISDALSRSGLDMSSSMAKSRLSATSKPDTVLLNITAEDASPTVAAALANSVADSMVSYVSSLERPVDGGNSLAKLTVVTPASVPDDPTTPNTVRNIVLGLLGGGVLGVLVAFVWSRFDDRVRTTDEAVSFTGSPALGQVPLDGLLSGRTDGVAVGGPLAVESFRKVRSNLAFLTVDAPVHKILISSATAGEGKTTTALGLAASFGEMGKNVLILDADLRNPGMSSRLGLSDTVGFTDYLTSADSISGFVRKFDQFDAIPAGTLPPNPTDLLGTQRARQGIDELASIYDVIIIDSAPIVPVADTQVVSQWCDGVLLVVREGVAGRSDVEESARLLSLAKARVLGFILNGCKESSMSNSYYGSYVGASGSE